MEKRDKNSLPKWARLRRPSEFNRVFREGHRSVSRYFVTFVAPNGSHFPRLGLAVGRKVGSAVSRNRIKRLIRESFRHHAQQLGGRDLVVTARASAGRVSHEELFRDLAHQWRRAVHGQGGLTP